MGSISGLCDFKDWTPAVEGMVSYYTCVYQNKNTTAGKKNSLSKVLSSKKPEHWNVNTQISISTEDNEKNVFVDPVKRYFYDGYLYKHNITSFNTETGVWQATSGQRSAYVLKGADSNNINFSLYELQKECVGHIAKESQSLSKYKFPNVSPSEFITADSWNLLLNALKEQIKTRMASNKYKKIYEALDEQDKPLNIVENITAPLLDPKINKKVYLDKLVTAIKNLQPKDKIGYILTTTYNFTPLSTPKYSFTNSAPKQPLTGRYNNNNIPQWLTQYQPYALPYDNNPNEKLNVDDILLSRNNINLIIDAIKADINDCVCYSDCNGYQVCWCHGNCLFERI